MYHWKTPQKSDRIQFIIKTAWLAGEVSEKVRKEEFSYYSLAEDFFMECSVRVVMT